jgi:hypothetical protein
VAWLKSGFMFLLIELEAKIYPGVYSVTADQYKASGQDNIEAVDIAKRDIVLIYISTCVLEPAKEK